MVEPCGDAAFPSGPPLPLPAHVAALLDAGVANRGRGYRGRFAPSPTGALHRGNLRTALLGWLEARLQGGEWLLRIDDLDTPRNRPGAEEGLLADLRWLGLLWDGPPLRQTRRRGLYATVLSALRRGGALYPCRCSRRMWRHRARAKRPHTLSTGTPTTRNTSSKRNQSGRRGSYERNRRAGAQRRDD